MKEVSRLLSIKGLTSSPYHPICNGLVERWNGTLKTMLKRVCQEARGQWHRYINPVLFAYREVPQESTGFSPFELLYGRSVRGPGAILKQLWTKDVEVPDVKHSYQYVTELKERLEESLKLAQQELEKSQGRYKRQYDRRAKPRGFRPGDKVLILLPTDQNKLLMQWKGPYVIDRAVGINDYKVRIGTKQKTFHVNMLKKYVERDEVPEDGSQDGTDVTVATAGVIPQEEDPELGELPELGNCHQSEGVHDVRIGSELEDTHQEELWELAEGSADVLTNLPGKTDDVRYRVRRSRDTPIRRRPYPLPRAVREELTAPG
jgi:hypothetical protein